MQTFNSPNFGALGYIHNSKVDYERSPESKHTVNTPFKVDELTELPKVGIIYAYSNMPTEPLQALLDASYQGIVVAGVGNGNMNAANLALLEEAAKKELPWFARLECQPDILPEMQKLMIASMVLLLPAH